MKITPSARILRMLGEIEIEEWKCLAELIDNAFDDFNEIIASGVRWPGDMKVSVTLPKTTARPGDAEIVVRDTSRGMARERLADAVRAGWSGNNQFDKLGLFGMGFNVSTARLGRKTRVLTTRAGDPQWIGVEIDLGKVGDDFEVPDIVEAKTDPSEHGTRIEVSRLHPERLDWLTRNGKALREQLGKVYGWLLEHRSFELWVGKIRVQPRRHCVWGANRAVTHGSGPNAERIPAYMEVDRPYTQADACMDCGHWQKPGNEQCDNCGKSGLKPRERRIHGWVGIQRYLDHDEFGIDFLRNGRKIVTDYKGIFQWSDINDPTARVIQEYPIELSQGGRIVGEIHLDHVRVDYKKDTFDTSDPQWRRAIEYLRGAAPMLPETGRKLGYEQNDSYLARLHRGFRRNDPGKRYLIPGDGQGAVHDKARQWGREFHKGTPEYQSDEIWWNQVLEHEERKAEAAKSKPDPAESGSVDDIVVNEALGLDSSDETGVAPTRSTPSEKQDKEPAEEPETDQQRIGRYKREGRTVAEIAGDLGHPDLGFMKVEVFSLDQDLLDAYDRKTAARVAPGPGGSATAFVDQRHPLFLRFGWAYEDAIVTELAGLLRARVESDLSITEIIGMVKDKSMRDTAIDAKTIKRQADELLGEIRGRMAMEVEDEPEQAFQYLTADERIETENAMIASGSRGTEPLEESSFVPHAPNLFLVRLVEEMPEVFLDGKVFRSPYEGVTSAGGQRQAVSQVTSLLSDVSSLAQQYAPGELRLKRTRLSMQLLLDELAPER